LVTLTADDIAPNPHPFSLSCPRRGRDGERATENRLIFLLQAVLIDRHVFGGIHCYHAGQGLGGGGVNADHAGMWTPGEQDFHVKHIRPDEVAGI
jgi:hypothetical protein